MHACDERTAREVFDRLDRNKDSMVNVREFIITVRKDEEVAAFFGLGGTGVRQEDGTREQIEQIFQSINTSGTREIEWKEFKAFFVPQELPTPTAGEGGGGADRERLWSEALQAEQDKSAQLTLLVTQLQSALKSEQKTSTNLQSYCTELRQMVDEYVSVWGV